MAVAEAAGQRDAGPGRIESGSRVGVRGHAGEVVQRPGVGQVESMPAGEPVASFDRAYSLVRAPEPGQCGTPGDERVGDQLHKLEVLGGLQHAVGNLDCPGVLLVEHVGTGELTVEQQQGGVVAKVREPLRGRREHAEARLEPIGTQQGAAEGGRRAGLASSVAGRRQDLDRRPEMGFGFVHVFNEPGALAGPLVQPRLILGIGGHAQRLLVKRHGLSVRPEPGGPLGGGAKGDAALRRKGLALRSVRCVGIGGEVMPGQASGKFPGPQRLEEAGCGEVANVPVGPRKRVVGDLADQGLDERVLAPLGAARVSLKGEQFAPDEPAKARRKVRGGDARHRRQPRNREALAEDGGVGHQGSILEPQPVEAAGDERRERLGDREVGQVADRPIRPALVREPSLGEEHPDRLHCVERDSARPPHDRADRVLRQARYETGQELAHRRLWERVQVERGEVALARAPARPLLEQLRAGERDDIDGNVPAPLHEVVDEVEQARVGEVRVLEDHDHRGGRREALEEGPPGSEQLLRADPGVDAQEGQQGRLDPAAVRLVGDVGRERLGHLRPGRRLVVGLHEPAPLADHLAECPEADSVAVRRAATIVPPDGLHQAVHVLEEFPGQPGLPDPARADHGHKTRSPLAAGGMEQVLEQSQLVVATDEGRLKGLAPVPAAALRDDPQGPPGRHGGGLALERLVTRFFEGDGAGRGPPCRFADEDGAGGGHGLEPGGGVHQVAGDHSLVGRAERDRRLAGQDSDPGLDRWSERPHNTHQIEPGPDRPLRVVLVRRRGAPDSHDRIADELLDRSPIAGDDLGGELEVVAERFADLLRIALGRERGEADEVGEQDGHNAALGDRGLRRGRWSDDRGNECRRFREPRSARPAELLIEFDGGRARRAGCGERAAALHAEPPARPVLGPAVRTDHALPLRSRSSCAAERTAGGVSDTRGDPPRASTDRQAPRPWRRDRPAAL